MSVELVTFLASAVVRHADQVSVAEQKAGTRVQFAVKVAPDDFGRLIGRNGQTIDAIRRLVAFTAAGKGVDAAVEVVDENPGGRRN